MLTNNIKCLCGSCSKNCNDCIKDQLALRKSLTYIYLRNGRKITNSCSFYSMNKVLEELLTRYKPLKHEIPAFSSIPTHTLKF